MRPPVIAIFIQILINDEKKRAGEHFAGSFCPFCARG
jgi:hypothetical protein